MNAFVIALLVIAGAVALFLIVKFIKFLFIHEVISKILSIVNAVLAMLISIPVYHSLAEANDLNLMEMIGYIFLPVFLMTLAWLFFMGEEIFDVTWDEETYDVEAVTDAGQE